MTLEQLKTLVKVADSGGILAASEALYKTQPTVSVAIRKLEEELGVELLSRDGYRATLTPAGEAICQQARMILKQGETLQVLASHLARGYEPEISIAIEASCPTPIVMKILSDSEKEFPNTQFHLTGETLWGALERLKLGEADIAISPWFEENLAYEFFPLTTVSLVTVASPQFRKSIRRKKLTLDDMKESVQVVVRDSSQKPPDLSFGYLDAGRHWYVTDHFTKKEIILAGMGWGRLHRHLIIEELEAGTLVTLEIDNYQTVIDIDICVARMLGKPAGPVATYVWEALKQFREDNFCL